MGNYCSECEGHGTIFEDHGLGEEVPCPVCDGTGTPQPVKIVDTMKNDPRAPIDENGQWNNEHDDPKWFVYDEGRIPFIWNVNDNAVYIGPHGTYHSDISDFYDIPYEGTGAARAYHGERPTRVVDYGGGIPDHVMDAMAKHFGVPSDEDENGFKFGNEQLQFGLDTTQSPKIIDTMRMDPYEHTPFIKDRRPWIYDPITHSVYVGDWGNYHSDTAKHYNVPYDNTGVLKRDPYTGRVNLCEKYDPQVPKEIVKAVSDHYRVVQQKQREPMRFGNEQLQFPDYSQPPKIVDDMPEGTRIYDELRKPWLYNEPEHTVYLGYQGAYHGGTSRWYNIPYKNTGGIRYHENGEPKVSEAYGGWKGGFDIAQAVGKHFGIDGHDYTESDLRFGNILDPIHDTLAPNVWDNPDSPTPSFKPQQAKWLESQVLRILSEAGYEGVKDHISLVITGSITTYQYSDRSDIDTSLFLDFDNFPEWSRAEMIGLFTEQLDEVPLPGTTYPLQIFVQPPEIKPEMIFKPGLRSGYSLEEDRWLVPPDKTRVADIEKDMNDTYTYALECADKMDRLITYEPHKAIQYWDQLHHRRREDQRAGKGDFAPSNVAYKFIVNRGLTEELGKIMGKKIVL